TKTLAEFVANLKYSDISEDALSHLRLLLLDYIGVASAGATLAESTKPFLRAVGRLDTAGGTATVFANDQKWDPRYAALLNAAQSHSLDCDDTHIAAVLHPGAPIFSTALAEAETSPLKPSVEEFWVAVASGYEVAVRLGLAIGFGGHEKGFHTTATAGLYGAICALCVLRKHDVQKVEDAFGLAVSMCGGTQQFMQNGSWNKRLHPGFAAQSAFTAVAMAEEGVIGAAEPLEGRYGLLTCFGDGKGHWTMKPLKQHWELLGTAVKPWPACRFAHGQIELAGEMGEKSQGKRVKSLTVKMGPSPYQIIGEPVEHKLRPKNIVEAQFSSYYQTAVAWLRGSKLGWKVYDLVGDSDVLEFITKITIDVDKSYDFLETAIDVEYEDGSKENRFLKAPKGEQVNPVTWEGEKEKFMGFAEAVYGENRCKEICDVVGKLEQHGISELMSLV
ncbi:2-methylcitrate dehydratase, partial [Rhizodiscina lignyota]